MRTLQLAPELTIYTVAELHPQWLAWLGETATPGTESAALDISAVNQVDAAGLQLLLSLKHMSMARGLQLHLLGSSNVLETGLAARVDDMAVLGGGADRVPGISMCALAGVESEALLFLLDAAGIAASAGSSCASGAQEPSHVLAAMRIEPRLGRGSIRFSFGRGNTMDDVSAILDVVPAAVRRLRELGS